MSSEPAQELDAFRFLREQLADEGSCLTPEECLVLWRARLSRGSGDGGTTPNAALLAAVARVDELQREMNPTKTSSTQDYLDEARSGAMYGHCSGDEPEVDRTCNALA